MGIWALDFQNGVDSGQGGEWSRSIQSASYSVINATRAINCQVTTSTPHGLGVGDHIHFTGIGGMTQLNSTQAGYETGQLKKVTSVIDATNVTLDIDSSGFSPYTSGGTMYQVGVGRCTPAAVRIPGHSFIDGDLVYISGVSGSSQANGFVYKCKNVTPNAIQLFTITDFPVIGVGWSPYLSGGTVTAYRKLVSEISKTNPAVLTVKGHGFSNGQTVFLDGGSMVEISGKAIVVQNITADTFEAQGVDATSYTPYLGGCFVRRPALSNQYLQYTIPGNDILIPGDEIRVRATTSPVQITTTSCTWTVGSATVSTSSSLIGTIAVNDFIGRQLLGGNGEVERFYKVVAITAGTITLDTLYYKSINSGEPESQTDLNSLYHLPQSAISAAGPAVGPIITNIKNCRIKGGYNSTYTAQDGQTWLKHAYGKAGSSNYGVSSYAGVIEKLNVVECYYGLSVNTAGEIISCTFLSSQIYVGNIAALGATLNKVIFAGTSNTSYSSLYQTAKSTTYIDCVVWGATSASTTSVAMTLSAIEAVLNTTGLKLVCAGEGLRVSQPSNHIKNIIIDRCYRFLSILSGGYNFLIEECGCSNPLSNTGSIVYIGTQCPSGTLRNMSLQGLLTLVSVSQSGGLVFQKCAFSHCNVGVLFDQYSNNSVFEECSFSNIGAYGVSIANSMVKSITFRGCTIEPGQEIRAFNTFSVESFAVPNYILENSFGGKTGKIYGRIQALADYSEYYSAGPSLKLTMLTSINTNFTPVEVVSEWARSGVGRTFRLKLKRESGAFSGIITPKFYFNGLEKLTLPSITSLNTSWTEYRFDCPNSHISTDGHLELKFSITGTASSIWIDDFTAEDL